MIREPTGRQRRAYFSTMAVVVLGLVLIMLVAVARHAALDLAGERGAFLAGCADQVVQSARAWVRAHGEDVVVGATTELPLDELLPAGVSGRLLLNRVQAGDDPPQITCELSLRRGRERYQRTFHWPVAHPETPAGSTAPS